MLIVMKIFFMHSSLL